MDGQRMRISTGSECDVIQQGASSDCMEDICFVRDLFNNFAPAGPMAGPIKEWVMNPADFEIEGLEATGQLLFQWLFNPKIREKTVGALLWGMQIRFPHATIAPQDFVRKKGNP